MCFHAPAIHFKSTETGLLLPALDQLVVIDGDWLFFFVVDLQLRSKVTLLDGILVPISDVMFLGEFRADIALNARLLDAAHDLFLRSAERIHGLLCGLCARCSIADCLPPELCQLRIVRNVGAGWRPLNAGR